jgi:hypothetical protein
MIVMFLLLVAEAVWCRVKLSKKEKDIEKLNDYNVWLSDNYEKSLDDIRNDYEKQLAAAKHRYYYYSATQAEQQRKHELRKNGVYYKRMIAGLDAGSEQYTEAFFVEFAEFTAENGLRPVPSYSDSKLVHEGHDAVTILLPFDAQDNPVRKVVGQ